MRSAIFTAEKSLRKQKICNTLRAIVAEIVCVQIFVSFFFTSSRYKLSRSDRHGLDKKNNLIELINSTVSNF